MSSSVHYRCSPALAGVCLLGSLAVVSAQSPLPAPAPPAPPPPHAPGGVVPIPRRAAALPGGLQPAQGPGQIAVLSQNFLVTLEVKNGEVTESAEVLTASPTLSFNVVLGASPSTTVTFNGTLQENEDGSLVLQYAVGGRVPERVEAAATSTAGAGPASVPPRLEYKDETSTGALHVTPGTPQTLLKSGPRRYSVLVTPAAKSR